jgi:ribonuclease HI
VSAASQAPGAAARVVDIYTDGACRGNPGPGGWAALLKRGERFRELHGAEPLTPTTAWSSLR